ncbi:hypothetical protein GUJ93_ZPchr0013g33990 [Zizania palustris]|uniref:Uncharacterized protein n=1 Tax=Zizania palustris TaxID=103762 RepID=A0A8J6BY88_ZIZPA|nr:hypothetical protein GUJ93_ZPchr0013g33990 [Zizania palustris]
MNTRTILIVQESGVQDPWLREQQKFAKFKGLRVCSHASPQNLWQVPHGLQRGLPNTGKYNIYQLSRQSSCTGQKNTASPEQSEAALAAASQVALAWGISACMRRFAGRDDKLMGHVEVLPELG